MFDIVLSLYEINNNYYHTAVKDFRQYSGLYKPHL